MSSHRKKTSQLVNVHEAKTRLSQLLAAVERGASVVIARAGRPVARLVRFEEPGERELGVLHGVFEVPDTFDDSNAEVEALFYGPRIEPK
jgi:prevent-host-death family protein